MKYSTVPGISENVDIDGLMKTYFLLVKLSFLKVAHHEQQLGKAIDAELQLALGVLLYTSGDYHKSVDCFKAALSVRPNVYPFFKYLGF